MISPGRMAGAGLPTSSGTVPPDGGTSGVLGKNIITFDGFSITIGLVLLLILVFLIWNTFIPRRRRR